MFAKRNSVTLAAIWLIILVVGTFWYTRDADQVVSVMAEEKKITARLSESQKEVRRLTDVEAIHGALSEHWGDLPKRIVTADEPSFTLSYLNWIVSTNNLNIYYDFVLNAKTRKDDVTTLTYTLAGEGYYNDIVQFIWHLTYEPILYVIENISMSSKGGEDEYVRFSAKLTGYTVDSESQINQDMVDLSASYANVLPKQADIFRTLVSPKAAAPVQREVAVAPPKPQLPKRQPGEIDVEKASLKAVTPTSVFIADESGKVQQLKIGDPVYLGRLMNINQTTNVAEFIITKFGNSERVTLRISQKQ